jgi:uncharacterized protein (DUF4213/DUF364 family)
MTKEEKLDGFEKELLPDVKESITTLLEYFEEKQLPSAYTACLGTYFENFISFSAIKWDEHCENYGVKMEFPSVEESINKIKSLDVYVEDFR